MNKPREFWLLEKNNIMGDRNKTNFSVYENPTEGVAYAVQFVYPNWYKQYHVIEKSAYDQLLEQSKKLADALESASMRLKQAGLPGYADSDEALTEWNKFMETK